MGKRSGRLGRRVWHFLPTLLALPLIFYLVGDLAEERPLDLLFLRVLAGYGEDEALEALDGLRLAVEETNAAGGVGGEPVNLLERVTSGTSLQAVADEASSAPVTAVFGYEPRATADALSRWGDVRTIPFVNLATSHGDAVAALLARMAGSGGAALLYDEREIPTAACRRQVIEGLRTAGGKLVLERAFEVRSGADAGFRLAIVLGDARGMAHAARALRSEDATVRLLVGGSGPTRALLEQGGEALAGALVVGRRHRELSATASRNFERRFAERYGREPDEPAFDGYRWALTFLGMLREGRTPVEAAAKVGEMRRRGEDLVCVYVVRSGEYRCVHPDSLKMEGSGHETKQ